MKPILLAAGLPLLALGPAGAVSLSLNFWDNSASNQDNNLIDPGEVAGIVPVEGSLWNQFGFAHGTTSANLTSTPLSDDSGSAAATLDFVLSSALVEFTGAVNAGGAKTPTRDLFSSSIQWDHDLGDTGNLVISGLGTNFTTPGYDVYVYFEARANGGLHTITVNGTNVVATDGSTFTGLLNDAALAPADANVAVVRGLTASTLTIDVDSDTGRAGIAGIQVVSTDHPAHEGIHLSFHNGSSTANAMAAGSSPTAQGTVVDTAHEYWNDIVNSVHTLNFSNLPLTSRHGLATGATASGTAGHVTFNSNGWAGGNKDWVMMEGWYGFRNSESLTIANLPPWITSGGYHVIIYGDSSAASRTMNYTVGDGTVSVPGTIQDSGKFSGTFTEDAHFAVFSGLSGSTLTITGNPGASDDRSAISGLRIVPGNPPNPPVLTDFAADDHYVAPGSLVTLTWNASNFDTLTLDDGTGPPLDVSGDAGSRQVTVNATTTFTLTAVKGGESISETLRVGAGPPRPNIVFFIVDDMGWQDTSEPFLYDGTGSPVVTALNNRYRTPNMEVLATRGMKFTNAYAMPVCTPTRNCLMTGKNSARHLVTNWTNPGGTNTGQNSTPTHGSPNGWKMGGLDPVEITLPALLQAAGYRTITAGKAHFGASAYAKDPLNAGFDINIGGNEFGQPGSYSGDYGQNSSRPVPHLEAYHNTGTHLTEALTLEMNAAISDAVNDGAPFYAYMTHYAVHSPFQDDPRFTANYPTLSGNARNYATMIEGMDKSLGDILAQLDALGVAEDTLVVFMSDNGGDAPLGDVNNSNAPLRHKKGSKYEGGVRVPLLAAWADPNPASAFQSALTIPQGSREDDIVACFDLYPTFLGAAGVSFSHAIDGIDLRPYLRADPGSHRPQELLIHFPHDHRSDYFTIFREGDWKLIYNFASDSHELYNLATDLSEGTNLAAGDPDRVMAMSRKMAQHLADAGAQWPTEPSGGADDPFAIPALPGVDLDGDGVPDNTEDANSNGLVDAGETDPDSDNTDGDRTLDGAELATGTDPLDPHSFFDLSFAIDATNRVQLTWPSAPGALYRVEHSDTLENDDWDPVQDDIPAHAMDPTTTFDAGILPIDPPHFWRAILK